MTIKMFSDIVQFGKEIFEFITFLKHQLFLVKGIKPLGRDLSGF